MPQVQVSEEREVIKGWFVKIMEPSASVYSSAVILMLDKVRNLTVGQECETLYKEVARSIPLGALCQVEFACPPFD